jgi:general secretion pathway protein F
MMTWEQLSAFNDEFVALVRAGIPLDLGFRRLGRELPGQLGQAMQAVGQRLESGSNLTQALGGTPELFPPVYQAVVRAGVESGRLAAALEGLSTTVRRVGETRRNMLVALIYPWIVFTVASAVLFLSAHPVTTTIAECFRSFRIEPPSWLVLLLRGIQPLVVTVISFWLLFTSVFVFWYFRSRQVTKLSAMRASNSLSRMFYLSRLAEATDLLALLVERRVPLGDAIPLAFAATGDRQLEQAATAFAGGIQRGAIPRSEVQLGAGRSSPLRSISAESPRHRSASVPTGAAGAEGDTPILLNPVPMDSFPAWLAWLLTNQTDGDGLIRALRQAAHSYRRRAQRLGRWLGVYVPIILSAGVGGLVALFYGLTTLAPLYQLLYQFSHLEITP